MNLPTFDSDTNESDEDYFSFVHALDNLGVAELIQAGDNIEEQKQAIKRYFQRGMKANLTIGELWDFFAISSGSVLERTGLGATEEKCKASIEIVTQASLEAIAEMDAAQKL